MYSDAWEVNEIENYCKLHVKIFALHCYFFHFNNKFISITYLNPYILGRLDCTQFSIYKKKALTLI